MDIKLEELTHKNFEAVSRIDSRVLEMAIDMVYKDFGIYHNSIDICTYAGYILRIDCSKAEEGLKTTPDSECALNALAIDNPVEYARFYLEPNDL